MRVLRFAGGLLAALLAQLLLVALAPPAANVIDPFLLALVYLSISARPGGAAVAGAATGLAHDALSGGLYGLHGFTLTAVGFLMAKVARLLDLQKSYYIALFFACAVLLEQLILQGLLLLLRQPEVLLPSDLALRVAIGGPAGALLCAALERLGESLQSWRKGRRAEIFLE